MAQHNRTIGRFQLTDIPPAARGIPQIEVTFDIDANGILNVSAKDKGTGKEQKIRIEASSGLSDEEIKRMIEDAEANAEADKQEKERIDKFNAADALIFTTEKQIKEAGDKLSEANKTALDEGLAELKKAYEAKDLEAVSATMETLNTAWQQASQEMYQAEQQAGAAQPGDEKSEEKDDNTTEVEYEEVEE